MSEAKRRRKAGMPLPVHRRLDIDAPATELLADLSEQLKRKNVAHIMSATGAGVIHLERIGIAEGAPDWPVFDCGHLTDVFGRPEEAIKEADWMRLDRQAITLQERGDLHLPFPQAVFVYRFHENPRLSPCVNIVFTEETDHIQGAIYTLQPHMPPPLNLWLRAPFMFHLEGGMIEFTKESLASYDPDPAAEYANDSASRASDVRVTMMLMAEKGPPVEPMERRQRQAPVTSDTEKPELAPDRVRIVRLLRPATGGAGATHSGITQRPHTKRGFYGTLKATGKVYWCPPRNVHGGEQVSGVFQVDGVKLNRQ